MARKENNYAFIDSQNLNLGARKGLGWELDFKRFRTYLRDRFKVRQAFLFIGFMPANQALYTQLQQFGYTLVFKPTRQLASGDVKGNVDAELVLHVMIQYDNFDQAVIVTGDGDFYCLLDYLRQKDKLKRIIIPSRKNCSALIYNDFAGYKSFLDGTKEKLARKHK